MITTGKYDAYEYCKHHVHYNYCEIVIFADGTIDEAFPSHLEALIKITGIERDVLWDTIPVSVSPLEWLTDYTGCVSVWYGYYSVKSLTQLQEATIAALIGNQVLAPNIHNMRG